MTDHSRELELILVPESDDPADNSWQEECRRLAARLASEVSGDATLTPAPAAAGPALGEGVRAIDMVTFSTLLLTVLPASAMPGVAARVWDVLHEWLGRRRGCRCVIKGRNGSEYVFDNLTKDELLKMMERHG